ncbi:MAG: hypothetical protein ABI895_34995, partial [Deltaproteobacteria bacterium]
MCLVLVGVSACSARDKTAPAPTPAAFAELPAPDGSGAASTPETSGSMPPAGASAPAPAGSASTEGIAVVGRADGMPNAAAANGSGNGAPETDDMPSAPQAPAAVDPGNAGDGDFVIDTFEMQPELTNRGAPMGRTFSFTMDSTTSTIF